MHEPNGLYYMRARYYDPEIGRFISEDPVGFEGGDINLYAYVGNNPINWIDPWGTEGRSVQDWANQAGLIVDNAIAESSIFEALIGQAGRNVDQNRRYVDTEVLKTIDLQHVTSAAFGPPFADTLGTLYFETMQIWGDPESAFKAEDIISNVVGGVARDLSGRRDTSVGAQVENIIRNAGPKGAPYGRY